MGESEKKDNGIVAGIFGVMAAVVAVGSFWEPLFKGKPEVLAGVGTAVLLTIGIALWVRYDAEGDLVFRVESLEDPIPAPHPSSVPPLVSLYSRGFIIGDDGHVQPDALQPGKIDLRRRRVRLGGLDKQLLERGFKLAMATAPPTVVESTAYRYTHRFGPEVDVVALATIADLLRDPSHVARCGIRKDRPYTNELHTVRLSPIDDAVPGPEQEWLGAVPPSQFGHALDDLVPGARCGVATVLSGHGWLTGVLNDPARARFRDPNGTLYLASGRPLIPEETSCLDLRTDGQL